MAHRYVCDKCGSESAMSSHVHRIDIPRLDYQRRPVEDDNQPFELCDICIIRLHEFLKPSPTAVQA